MPTDPSVTIAGAELDELRSVVVCHAEQALVSLERASSKLDRDVAGTRFSAALTVMRRLGLDQRASELELGRQRITRVLR